jgi:hypothetical protein
MGGGVDAKHLLGMYQHSISGPPSFICHPDRWWTAIQR